MKHLPDSGDSVCFSSTLRALNAGDKSGPTGLGSEQGMVLVMVLLVLMAVTLIGVYAVRMATSEVRIVRNEKRYYENLYLTESGNEFAEGNCLEPVNELKENTEEVYQFQSADLPDELEPNTITVKYLERRKVEAGYDVTKFIRRDYAVSSSRNGAEIQTRGWKVFNRQ